jgi:hypothetical protein
MWTAPSDLDYYAQPEEPEVEVDDQPEPPEWAAADLPLPEEPGRIPPRQAASALKHFSEVA